MNTPSFLETPPQISRLALPLILVLATFFASLPPTPLCWPATGCALGLCVSGFV